MASLPLKVLPEQVNLTSLLRSQAKSVRRIEIEYDALDRNVTFPHNQEVASL